MSPNPNIDPQQVVRLYRSIKDVSGLLEEVGALPTPQLLRAAPHYVQRLNLAAKNSPIPTVQSIVSNTSTILQHVYQWQLKRKLDAAVKPTIPVCVAWDAVPAATAGSQATVQSPYSGQPFRVTEILCTAEAPFRFVEFNIGGVDFAEPSRTRVTYTGAVGVPAAATRGLDFPQIKARDLTCCGPDNVWKPWVKADFTSDATITLTPYNYGTAASSVILTIFMRSNPCGQVFKNGLLLPVTMQAQRNAIMGASYLASLSPDELE